MITQSETALHMPLSWPTTNLATSSSATFARTTHACFRHSEHCTDTSWFDLSCPPKNRQQRYEPPPGSLLTLPFSQCVHHRSSPKTCLAQTTFKITECTHTHVQTHKNTHVHVPVHIYTHVYHESSRTQPQLEWKCNVSVLYMLFMCPSASDQRMCENKPKHTHMCSHIACDRAPNTQKIDFFLK